VWCGGKRGRELLVGGGGKGGVVGRGGVARLACGVGGLLGLICSAQAYVSLGGASSRVGSTRE